MPEREQSAPISVPGYEGFELLGSGGFSRVWKAYQPRFSRWVAIKVLNFDIGDNQSIRGFERECYAMGRVSSHPNIVTVLDSGLSQDGQPFIVMDYFTGGTYADRLESATISIDELLRMGVKISGALQTAHDAGILHRDIKPHNILVSRFNEPALSDFGISKIDEEKTSTGFAGYTVHYAPPEVLDGQQATVRSDLYSLGATLYCLVEGVRPFDGPDQSVVATAVRIVTEPPPEITRSDCPPALASAIHRLMSRAVADRPRTANDIAAEFQRIQEMEGFRVSDSVVASVGGLVSSEDQRVEDDSLGTEAGSFPTPEEESADSVRRSPGSESEAIESDALEPNEVPESVASDRDLTALDPDATIPRALLAARGLLDMGAPTTGEDEAEDPRGAAESSGGVAASVIPGSDGEPVLPRVSRRGATDTPTPGDSESSGSAKSRGLLPILDDSTPPEEAAESLSGAGSGRDGATVVGEAPSDAEPPDASADSSGGTSADSPPIWADSGESSPDVPVEDAPSNESEDPDPAASAVVGMAASEFSGAIDEGANGGPTGARSRIEPLRSQVVDDAEDEAAAPASGADEEGATEETREGATDHERAESDGLRVRQWGWYTLAILVAAALFVGALFISRQAGSDTDTDGAAAGMDASEQSVDAPPASTTTHPTEPAVAATTTTQPPAPVVPPPSPVKDVRAVYLEESTVRVSWDTSGARGGDTYRIRLTGGGSEPRFTTVADSPVELDVTGLARVCTTVQRLRDDRESTVIVGCADRPASREPEEKEFGALVVGDCFTLESDAGTYSQRVTVGDCFSPHTLEVFQSTVATSLSESYPGDESVDSLIEDQCDLAFRDYVGTTPSATDYGYWMWWPLESFWGAGEYPVLCAAFSNPDGDVESLDSMPITAQTIRDSGS